MGRSADTLLIGGGFFGYAKEICAALRGRGRQAIWFEDRPSTDTLTKTAVRLAPRLTKKRSDRYFDRIISENRGNPIQDVLVIKGEALSISSIISLRAAWPRARFTAYFWDSYRNMPVDSRDKVSLFDAAFTFDSVDACHDSRLQYRPLFFIEEYARLPDRVRDIDVLFFGTAHTDRYDVLRRLSVALPQKIKFRRLLYFPSRLIYATQLLIKPGLLVASPEDLIFEPLEGPAVRELIARTRIVVDIERPMQSGLTIRTIEMLGAGRKVITTNDKICDAEFFDARNICVIDRNCPIVTEEFLDSPYISPDAGVLQRYSLSGWLDDVLPATRTHRM